MTGKKGRCVVCVGKHNPCAECKRQKAAAAALPGGCRQCRQSPCECPAASSKRQCTAAPEGTAQLRCASCGAWANSCDDCQRQPPADPLPLTFCPACTATPCCKGGCCQLAQVRSAHTKPRTPAPSGHADIGGVEAGSGRCCLRTSPGCVVSVHGTNHICQVRASGILARICMHTHEIVRVSYALMM